MLNFRSWLKASPCRVRINDPRGLGTQSENGADVRRADRSVLGDAGFDFRIGGADAAGYLADGGDADTLCHGLQDLIFADHAVLPIFVTHMLKTLVAARDEYEALGDHPDRQRPLLAAVRFLAAPQSEHRLASAIEDALRFVVDAKTPRRLTP